MPSMLFSAGGELMMGVEYQEEPQPFLSIEGLDSNYKDFRHTMCQPCVKYCVREYYCRGQGGPFESILPKACLMVSVWSYFRLYVDLF